MTETTAPVRTGMLIDGAQVGASDDRVLEVTDPARPDEVVGHAAAGTRADAARAVAAAAAAGPAWAARPVAERAALLRAATGRLAEGLDERVDLLVREVGKVRWEAEVELAGLGQLVDRALALEEEYRRERVEEGPPLRSVVSRRPVGVVVLVVPFNWPLSILFATLPYALLAGNTVVVKPPPSAPLTVVRTLAPLAAALPPGVLNVVTGRDDEVGAQLLADPLVAKVHFTGSVESGRRVLAASAPTLKRVTLELGGNDPAVLLDDVDRGEATLQGLVLGAFMTAGQVCAAVKRLYVHRSVLPWVAEGLAAALDATVVGHGLDAGTTMGPLHRREQRDRLRALAEDARARGGQVREAGSAADPDAFAKGWFTLPALITGVDQDAEVVRREQFGPLLPIVPFDSDEQALRMANDSEFGLGASVWSGDPERAAGLARRLEAGYVWVNAHGPWAQDDRVPFGGVKQSGIGREHGLEGALEFVEAQSVSRLLADAG